MRLLGTAVLAQAIIFALACRSTHDSSRASAERTGAQDGAKDAAFSEQTPPSSAAAAEALRTSDSSLPSLRHEALRKLGLVIIEARRLWADYGDDASAMDLKFAEFKRSNPDLFVFEVQRASVAHIRASAIGVFDATTHVFAWVWLGELGAVGYSDGHVETTTDRDLFDRVVAAGRGPLIPSVRFMTEDGVVKQKRTPAGPIDKP